MKLQLDILRERIVAELKRKVGTGPIGVSSCVPDMPVVRTLYDNEERERERKRGQRGRNVCITNEFSN